MSTHATATSQGVPTLGHFINGKPTGASKRTAPVFDPATGKIGAQVSLASADETRAAIKAAREAFPAWSETPPLQRARVPRAK